MVNITKTEAVLPQISHLAEAGMHSDIYDTTIDDIHIVVQIMALGQIICKQVNGAVSRLCQEVRHATRNRAQLLIQKEQEIKHASTKSHVAMVLPVQFGHTIYGSLNIGMDPRYSDQPAIALVVAQLLAQSCGWLLYTLEQSTFLQSQCQYVEYQMHEPLTKREREVIELMFRGRNQDEIAAQLCIAPATVNKHRQHIYEHLGVHNERDAVLAAYHIGILSLLDDLIEQGDTKR
jgi:ATP/maltotriose-dependent transcriptional regulator MalT